jgi:TLD
VWRGQVGYFSLLVDDTLDSGMSRPAATYGAPCLASAETFKVETVEVWGVDPPEADAAAAAGIVKARLQHVQDSTADHNNFV